MDGMVQRGIKRVIWHRNERRKRLGAQGRERERARARQDEGEGCKAKCGH